MTHVRTSTYHPQSNGKPERWPGSLKSEGIRPGTPLSQQNRERLIQQYVDHYNVDSLQRRFATTSIRYNVDSLQQCAPA
jgi:putative transposase